MSLIPSPGFAVRPVKGPWHLHQEGRARWGHQRPQLDATVAEGIARDAMNASRSAFAAVYSVHPRHRLRAVRRAAQMLEASAAAIVAARDK